MTSKRELVMNLSVAILSAIDVGNDLRTLAVNCLVQYVQANGLIYTQVPLIMGHHSKDRPEFAAVGTAGLDYLNNPFQMPTFHFGFQRLVKLLASLLLTFASTANIQNALWYKGAIF
jgi:hypothetical protein